jgi:hypothetical protein
MKLPRPAEAGQWSFSIPHPQHIRTEVSDFVAALSIPRKSMNEIKVLTGQANGIKSLKKTQSLQIIKEVKAGKNTTMQWHSNHQQNKTH